jgi:mono/diheme cytochrome c family protein
MSIESKATVLALAVSLGLLGVTFGLSPFLQPGKAADPKREAPTNTVAIKAETALGREAKEGYRLFEHNCAHCHGEDARGDEGPDLHGLRKSDSRLTTIIKGGIKGEMPAFAKKFNDADIQALIAFLRTLKEQS